MTFRKGEVISDSTISNFFKNLYIKINDSTYIQMGTLTTGQFLEEGEDSNNNEYITELMNTSSRQYFDSQLPTGVNYLQYYIDQIELIESRS